MDRQWIKEKNKLSKKYTEGVLSFIEVARQHVNDQNETKCPCMKCQNIRWHDIPTIYSHLCSTGMSVVYDRWIYHGEPFEEPSQTSNLGNDADNGIADMLHDAFPRHTEQDLQGEGDGTDGDARVHRAEADKYERLMAEAERELFPGTGGCSVLSMMIKLMLAKAEHHWTNRSFDVLLEILSSSCPKPHNIPASYYEADKMLKDLGLGYENIHACLNDCALFYKEHEWRDTCPVCDEPRYKQGTTKKGKKIPQKVLRYLPLKPRLQRMFMSKEMSDCMRWHKEKRVDEEGVLRHPADSFAWKEFDRRYPVFARDPRNIRLGLATDGFNPFGNMSLSYSMWPVIVVPYNLPPWMCMKAKYSIMTLLIPGPSAPGKDIDVYLRPLIDELKELWDQGVATYDKLTDSGFNLRAAVMWTINDFPAYGNLSGWSTKGFLACPVCLEDTPYKRLRKKTCYIGARRYLRKNHPWRKDCAHFNGKCEMRDPPRVFTGDDILHQFDRLRPCRPGKHKSNKDRKRKRTPAELNWTNKSIFFELEYWSKLEIRNNLDVMHIESNICNSVLGTCLNIEGKTKDTVDARLDMLDMNIQNGLQLHRDEHGDIKKWKPVYTLEPNERRAFCEFLKSVKFPDGYAANISRCVKDGKISGLKSHDRHVLFQRLLPVGIRPYLPDTVCAPLVELSSFFQQICSKTLKVTDLDRLETDIVFILCKLERIFPPAFFDVMVHLVIHLPREAKLAGPVGFRWMYPIERFLGRLKGYVFNKANAEGSLLRGYLANENHTFCSMYLRKGETSSAHSQRQGTGAETKAQLSVFAQIASPNQGYKLVQWSELEMESAYWYILDNCDEVEPFKDEHRQILEEESPTNIEQRQRKLFPKWFKNHIEELIIQGSSRINKELCALAYGPDRRVSTYTGCIVSGIRWHTKDTDEGRTTQNSGVMVPGTHKDKESNFYGQLVDVLKIGFIDGYYVVLFKCEWFNTQSATRQRKKVPRLVRDYHLTSVNITNLWYKDNPYVLAKQAQQIFYLQDPKLGPNWRVIEKIQHRHVWDVPEHEVAHEAETAYEDGIDQAAHDIFPTSRDESHLPITSLRREDAEPDIVMGDIYLEPVTHDDEDYDDFIDDDAFEEDDFSGNEEDSVHSDNDYSDLE